MHILGRVASGTLTLRSHMPLQTWVVVMMRPISWAYLFKRIQPLWFSPILCHRLAERMLTLYLKTLAHLYSR